MTEGQEPVKGQEPVLDSVDAKFIDEFKRMAQEHILRAYETKHTQKIINASLIVRDAFDKKWKEITGQPYFQAITTMKPSLAAFDRRNDVSVSNPQALGYQEVVDFKSITWHLFKRKIGKKMRDNYTIDGISTIGTFRPIARNLSVEQLYNVLGDDMASKIRMSAKNKDTDTLDGLNAPIAVEGFWQVRFAPQKDQNDTIDVRPCVNGLVLRMLRMRDVIVPGYFLADCDQGTRPIYTHEPGKGRQKIGSIQKYPYTVMRKSSLEEYLEEKKKGDAEQREFERKQEEVA